MKEASYKQLKDKALPILTFSNKTLSYGILMGVNALFGLTLIFKLSFIFMISVICMAVTMVALFCGFLKQTFAPEQVQYFLHLYRFIELQNRNSLKRLMQQDYSLLAVWCTTS